MVVGMLYMYNIYSSPALIKFFETISWYLWDLKISYSIVTCQAPGNDSIYTGKSVRKLDMTWKEGIVEGAYGNQVWK